jgi:ribose transport system ATP-binding protein
MIYQEVTLAPHLSVSGKHPPRLRVLLAGLDQHKGARGSGPGRPWPCSATTTFPSRGRRAQFSIAEQQVIEIARALLLQPRVLIMDEPTSSLTQADTEKLFQVIGRLRAQGVSIIYISHFLEECRRICDRYTVLKDGETVGAPAMKGARRRTIWSPS